MDEEVAEFARSFRRFLESMSNAAGAERISPMREMLDAHLGIDASSLPVVSETFPPYDHVNVQTAVTAYLHTGTGPTASSEVGAAGGGGAGRRGAPGGDRRPRRSGPGRAARGECAA